MKLAIMRKLAGTKWGANEKDTQDSVRGISETRPGVQFNCMVYNCKDQPTIPRQDSKPGTTHHYRRNEVHTHHIHGTNHRYTTFATETTSKSPSSSREIQVPSRRMCVFSASGIRHVCVFSASSIRRVCV